MGFIVHLMTELGVRVMVEQSNKIFSSYCSNSEIWTVLKC